jgi:hypothetical protein
VGGGESLWGKRDGQQGKHDERDQGIEQLLSMAKRMRAGKKVEGQLHVDRGMREVRMGWGTVHMKGQKRM